MSKSMLARDAFPIEAMSDLSLGNDSTSTTSNGTTSPLHSSVETNQTNISTSQEVSQSSRSSYSDVSQNSNSRLLRPHPSVSSSDQLSSSSSSCNTYDQLSSRYSPLTDDKRDEELRWRNANRYLKFDIEQSPNAQLWKQLAMSLFNKIEAWHRETLLQHRTPVYDACVIHSHADEDQAIAKNFIRVLSDDGLNVVSLTNLEFGEEQLDASEKILNGSFKIFVLDSPTFYLNGIHKLQHQESMMRQLSLLEWKHKIIPLRLSREHLLLFKKKYNLPIQINCSNGSNTSSFVFGTTSIKGLQLGSDLDVIEQVRTVITMDLQENTMIKRREAEQSTKFAFEALKQSKCDQLRAGIENLMRQMNNQENSEDLAMLCLKVEDLPILSTSGGLLTGDLSQQIVNLSSCKQISIGPAFHFNLNADNGFKPFNH